MMRKTLKITNDAPFIEDVSQYPLITSNLLVVAGKAETVIDIINFLSDKGYNVGLFAYILSKFPDDALRFVERLNVIGVCSDKEFSKLVASAPDRMISRIQTFDQQVFDYDKLMLDYNVMLEGHCIVKEAKSE